MADPRRMAQLGESVRRCLATANQVRITSTEGTDLAFTVGKPPVVGGTNRAGEWFVALAGATLEAAGRAIVKEGRIVRQGCR